VDDVDEGGEKGKKEPGGAEKKGEGSREKSLENLFTKP